MSDPIKQRRVYTRNWWKYRRIKLLGKFDKKAYHQAHLDYAVFGTISNLYLAAKIVYQQNIAGNTNKYQLFLKDVLKVPKEDLQRFKMYIEDNSGMRAHRINRDRFNVPLTTVQTHLALRLLERNQHEVSDVLGNRNLRIVPYVNNKPEHSHPYIGHYQIYNCTSPNNTQKMTVLVLSTDFLQRAHTIKYVVNDSHAFILINRDRIMLNPSSYAQLSYEVYLRLRSEYSKILIKIMSDKGHTPSGILVNT